MFHLLFSLVLGARAETCLAGEAYRDGKPFRTTAVLTEDHIAFTGFPGTASTPLQASGDGVTGADGERGVPTVDGGLYWVAGEARAVLYPSDCATPTPPQRNVRVAVRYSKRVPRDWEGLESSFLAVLNRGNVNAVWDSDEARTDVDYILSIDRPDLDLKSNKGAWSATATFSLKARRIVHTQTGDVSFDIGTGAMSGDNGMVSTNHKDAMIRAAQYSAIRTIPEWVHSYSELGLNMRMLSFGSMGAELSWGREDGVVPGQRYRVKRGEQQSGTLIVVAAPEGESTSRALWERRKLGAPVNAQMELQPLPRAALLFGMMGGLGLDGGGGQNRAVELFAGGRWQMGVVGGALDFSIGAAPFGGGDSAFVAGNLHLMAPLGGVHLGAGPCFVAATETDVYAPGVVSTFVLPLAPKVSLLARARVVPDTGDAQIQLGLSNW